MAGEPWLQYQPPAQDQGPWTQYQPQAQPQGGQQQQATGQDQPSLTEATLRSGGAAILRGIAGIPAMYDAMLYPGKQQAAELATAHLPKEQRDALVAANAPPGKQLYDLAQKYIPGLGYRDPRPLPRYVAAGAEAVPGTLAMPHTGFVGLLRNLAMGVGGGLGAEGADELAKNLGVPEGWKRDAVRLAGSLGGSLLGGRATSPVSPKGPGPISGPALQTLPALGRGAGFAFGENAIGPGAGYFTSGGGEALAEVGRKILTNLASRRLGGVWPLAVFQGNAAFTRKPPDDKPAEDVPPQGYGAFGGT